MYIEDEYTELKVELTKDIKKEIVAFANTKGGKIYVGIDDYGKVVGLNNVKEDMGSLSGMIREGIKSDLTLYTSIISKKVENKDIIELNIMEAPNKPYYLSDKGIKTSGVYLRYGNTSAPASEEVIKKMLIESQGDSFETAISKNQNLHFLSLVEIFSKNKIELDENKFKTLNIINLDDDYTNLGLLLSDECPYSIKCAIYNGKNKIEFKDRKEFTGSILKQVNDVFQYLELYNKTKGKIIGLERIDRKDYPEYALREALLNAVIHRNYNYTGSILISLYDDHFEITSLGGLVKGLNINDLYLGVSESRNPNLANIFYRLKYVESFGTGIGRILESYSDFEKKPVLIDTDNAFMVTLYNMNYTENKEKILPSNLSQEEKIIEYLKLNNKMNRKIVESLLDVSSTRAKTILKNMCNSKIIIAIGTGKNTMYMLK